MKDLLRKLSSRKFWLAAAGVVTGIAMVFGFDSSTVETIAGAVTAVASVMTYVIMEGRVDAQSVKTAVEAVQNAVDLVKEAEEKNG